MTLYELRKSKKSAQSVESESVTSALNLRLEHLPYYPSQERAKKWSAVHFRESIGPGAWSCAKN